MDLIHISYETEIKDQADNNHKQAAPFKFFRFCFNDILGDIVFDPICKKEIFKSFK